MYVCKDSGGVRVCVARGDTQLRTNKCVHIGYLLNAAQTTFFFKLFDDSDHVRRMNAVKALRFLFVFCLF